MLRHCLILTSSVFRNMFCPAGHTPGEPPWLWLVANTDLPVNRGNGNICSVTGSVYVHIRIRAPDINRHTHTVNYALSCWSALYVIWVDRITWIWSLKTHVQKIRSLNHAVPPPREPPVQKTNESLTYWVICLSHEFSWKNESSRHPSTAVSDRLSAGDAVTISGSTS